MQTATSTTHRAAGTNGRSPRDLATVIREANCTTKRMISRGQFVVGHSRVPTGVCLIETGIVTHMVNKGDKLLVVGFAGKGDLLYTGRLLTNTPEDPAAFLDRSTSAMVEVHVIEIPWNIARRIPELVLLAQEMNERERLVLEQRLLAAHYSPVPVRLAAFLIQMCERFGMRQSGGGTLLDLPITHQQIADAIGSTRETVTITLGEFKNMRRLIKFDGRRIFIVDQNGLRTLAKT